MLQKIFESMSDDEKEKVWKKAMVVDDYDPNKYRKDVAGAWISWDEYGNTDSELGFGWEIDHIKPTAKNGSDDIGNLQPLQWYNNRVKSDDYPEWTSAVSSEGTKNIYKEQKWIIR